MNPNSTPLDDLFGGGGTRPVDPADPGENLLPKEDEPPTEETGAGGLTDLFAEAAGEVAEGGAGAVGNLFDGLLG